MKEWLLLLYSDAVFLLLSVSEVIKPWYQIGVLSGFASGTAFLVLKWKKKVRYCDRKEETRSEES